MKYQDNAISVNGFYIGASIGARLADSLAPTDDGLNYRRDMERFGTILGDAIDTDFPELVTDGDDDE